MTPEPSNEYQKRVEAAADFMFECSRYLGDCGMKASVETALREAFARHRTRAEPDLEERLRIMAKQKLPDEMSEEDQENADWQGGYKWFCDESRAIFSALTRADGEA